jgi:RimJ/RimL family protein N-acetyltransferase
MLQIVMASAGPAAPSRLETDRLVLRRPVASDAAAIFERYSSDPEVTRYLGWRRHRTIEDTRTFLAFSDAEWERWPAGPYLIESRDGRLIGGTGLGFESPDTAATGYVFARDAWGQGYASEALDAMVALARQLGVRRLFALCHPEHRLSWRVLQKGGFVREGTLPRYAEFPNLRPGVMLDVLKYLAPL